MSIKVLIADPDAELRHSLRQLLESALNIDVVAEAYTEEEALSLAGAYKPDVVLLGFAAPFADESQLIRGIKHSQPRSHIVKMADRKHFTYHDLMEAFGAGAIGFIFTDTVSSEVVDAVRYAYRNLEYISYEVDVLQLQEYVFHLRAQALQYA